MEKVERCTSQLDPNLPKVAFLINKSMHEHVQETVEKMGMNTCGSSAKLIAHYELLSLTTIPGFSALL